MQPSPHQVLSGTLLAVLSPGDASAPWRGLVQPFEQVRPVCLVLDASPGDIQPGDDLHLYAVRHADANADARFPDEVTAADVWSSSGNETSASVVDPSLSQQAMQDAHGLAEHLGLPTLVSLAQQGAILLRQAGDSLVVGRSRQSLDPAIAWVMRRFDDPATNHLRGIGTLFLDPAVFMTAHARREPVRWVNDALASVFRRGPAMDPAGQTERLTRISRLTAMLPIMLPAAPRANFSQMFADSLAAFQATGNAATPVTERFGIVAPYPVQSTGLLLWQSIALMEPMPLMPRQFIPCDARNKLVAAHETAHAYNAAFGHATEQTNRMETFADAVAVISYVVDTGDVAVARQWADMRSMGVLFGVNTHATGPACEAAIRQAETLRQRYGENPVPLQAILEEAELISQRTTHPAPEDLSQMHGLLLQHDPAFQTRSIADIGAVVEAVLARDQYTLSKPTETARMFRSAVEAMRQSTFTTPELGDPAILAEALRVERADLEDTSQHLRRIGLGPLVPETLSRLRLSLNLAGLKPAVPPVGLGEVGSPEVMVPAGATAAAPARSPSLLQLVRQMAEQALHGAVNWVQGRGAPSSLQARLAQARDAQLRQAESSHAKAFHVKRAPSGGLVMLAGGGEAPVCPSFTMALPERLQRLSALSQDALALLAEGPSSAVGDTTPLPEAMETVRAALQEVAWTLRVDQSTWSELANSVPEDGLVAIETVAASTAEDIGVMWDPRSLSILAEMADTYSPEPEALDSAPPRKN